MEAKQIVDGGWTQTSSTGVHFTRSRMKLFSVPSLFDFDIGHLCIRSEADRCVAKVSQCVSYNMTAEYVSTL